MKRLLPILMLSLLAVTVQGQSDSLYITLPKGKVVKYAVSDIYSMGFTRDVTPHFPAADNSTAFNKLDPATSVMKILQKIGTECTDTLGRINITDEQYNEIKTFTDNLVSGLTKQYDIYRKCYEWITSNVRYQQNGYVDNDPYPVFKNKLAICQGYANLLVVMLHGQGVPAMVVNGYLQSSIYDGMLVGGGHAWNYVCCDGVWYVSDPTNSGQNPMSNINNYKSWLAPTSMDIVVSKEDDCWIDFYECRLNISKVTTGSNVFVTPYSVHGFKVTSFNPHEAFPSNVRELYIGSNIESLGQGTNGLNTYAKNVEYVHVDPNNEYLIGYAGVVYYSKKYTADDTWKTINKNVPVYIPAMLKSLELLAVDVPEGGIVYDKESIKDHNALEEIMFPKETKTICGYAVEKCPNLKLVYVPQGATVESGAFPSNVRIVYM